MGPKMEVSNNGEDHVLAWEMWNTSTQVPLIDINDTGKYLDPVLMDPEKYDGKNLTAATSFMTPAEMMESLSKVTGKKWIAKGASDPEAASKINNEQYYYGSTGKKDWEWTLAQMNEKPAMLETWFEANGPWP